MRHFLQCASFSHESTPMDLIYLLLLCTARASGRTSACAHLRHVLFGRARRSRAAAQRARHRAGPAELRQRSQLPVLMLSVRDAESEKVRALDSGANDYMTKPFGIQELMARLRVLLRDLGCEPCAGHPLPAHRAGQAAPEAGRRRGRTHLAEDRVGRRLPIPGRRLRRRPGLRAWPHVPECLGHARDGVRLPAMARALRQRMASRQG